MKVILVIGIVIVGGILFFHLPISKRSSMTNCQYDVDKAMLTYHEDATWSGLTRRNLVEKCMLTRGYVLDQDRAEQKAKEGKYKSIDDEELDSENWTGYWTARLLWDDKKKPPL